VERERERERERARESEREKGIRKKEWAKVSAIVHLFPLSLSPFSSFFFFSCSPLPHLHEDQRAVHLASEFKSGREHREGERESEKESEKS
jgi:hypothetical protein